MWITKEVLLEEETLEENVIYGENSVIEHWTLCHQYRKSRIGLKLELDNDKSVVRILGKEGWNAELLSQ